jgi:hypothetical protein
LDRRVTRRIPMQTNELVLSVPPFRLE